MLRLVLNPETPLLSSERQKEFADAMAARDRLEAQGHHVVVEACWVPDGHPDNPGQARDLMAWSFGVGAFLGAMVASLVLLLT